MSQLIENLLTLDIVSLISSTINLLSDLLFDLISGLDLVPGISSSGLQNYSLFKYWYGFNLGAVPSMPYIVIVDYDLFS